MCCDKLTLAAYIEGVLPQNELEKIDRHLGDCSKCALLYAQLIEGVMEETVVPEDFSLKVMELLPALSQKKKKHDVLRFAAAAIIAVVFWQTGFFRAFAELPVRTEIFSSQVLNAVELENYKRQVMPKKTLVDKIDAFFQDFMNQNKNKQ